MRMRSEATSETANSLGCMISKMAILLSSARKKTEKNL